MNEPANNRFPSRTDLSMTRSNNSTSWAQSRHADPAATELQSVIGGPVWSNTVMHATDGSASGRSQSEAVGPLGLYLCQPIRYAYARVSAQGRRPRNKATRRSTTASRPHRPTLAPNA